MKGMLPEAELLPPKVLVVDSNVRHCLLYRMEMEAQGYEVVCAHNGREALLQLQDRRFDLAVVDVVLPDISGNDLLLQISSSRHPKNHPLPIIINTAYPYTQQQTRKMSADAFLIKSSNLDELLGKVTAFLRGKPSSHKTTPRHFEHSLFQQRGFTDCIA
jgi:DNA-binding response OmpR family regulator